jgi:adenylate cyclase
MTYRIKHNLWLIVRICLIVAAAASALSTWQGYSYQGRITLWSVMNGVVDGLIVTLLLSSYTLLVCDILLKDTFHRLSFTTRLVLNSCVYAIGILLGRALGRAIMEGHGIILWPTANPVARVHFIQSMIVAISGSVLFHFFYQNNRLLGPRALVNFLTGRYHTPVRENRVVMFMDLASSTTIAEKLGDERYLQFLNAVFVELTEPILETRAEIYKYVGDELIVSWPAEIGLQNANCLRLFFLASSALRKKQSAFEESFQCMPRFRAGVHLGSVVLGEVGDLKQEIALIGDLMNTAARLAAHSRSAGHDLVASQDLVGRMQLPETLQAHSLGPVDLRGKMQPVELAGISSRAADQDP